MAFADTRDNLLDMKPKILTTLQAYREYLPSAFHRLPDWRRIIAIGLVADRMIACRHRVNTELITQGGGDLGSLLFGSLTRPSRPWHGNQYRHRNRRRMENVEYKRLMAAGSVGKRLGMLSSRA
ncbi:hypothetical protein [Paracoccus alkanivorans]|uniref:Uncharacterized protein n=1 Tax=Paracoccus alkanivorans TaxID=2116655 RepID=A0A3M0MJ31_9RHOB|nr:hypothetical protein [Paracoccus alkanivorans]RMC37578.1 hypothetical protein C9E81_02170 [Paracoccus alkanivorans]